MKDYNKYRWFFTSSNKLVVGGKNALQNDSLLKSLKERDENYYVMHTSLPGSPFCIIISDEGDVTKNDLEECAIYTGCFSKAWKDGKRETIVDIFKMSQLSKNPKMKTGTWGVSGKVKKISCELKLILTKQKKIYRAVPESTTNEKDSLIVLFPGKVDKIKIVDKIISILKTKEEKKEELLSALPAGGIKIKKR